VPSRGKEETQDGTSAAQGAWGQGARQTETTVNASEIMDLLSNQRAATAAVRLGRLCR
jgi:hypothetical protein